MNKSIRKIIGGLIGGITLSGIWLLVFLFAIQNTQYYGLAILPAILLAVFLFIIGAIFGGIITK